MTRSDKPGWRFQFRLTLLLLLMTLAGVSATWMTGKSQDRAAWGIRNLRGQVWGSGVHGDRTATCIRLPTSIGDTELICLKRFRRVDRLVLCNTQISDAGIALLKGLDCRTLNLGQTGVSDSGLANLRELPRLESLVLQDAPRVTDAGLEELKHLVNLRSLDLDGTRVTGPGLRHLVGLSNLQDLSIGHTRVTDLALANLRGAIGLRSLILRGNAISGSGLQQIQKETSELRFLCLSDTRADDDGLVFVARMSNLETLNLANTRVTDEGLKHLRQSTSLRRLQLSGTRVSDAGLIHLKHLNNLEVLDLDQTRITGSGLAYLEAFRNLRKLSIRDTLAFSDEVTRLQAVLPDTTIHHNAWWIPTPRVFSHLSGSQRRIGRELYGRQIELDICDVHARPILSVYPRSIREFFDSFEEIRPLLLTLTSDLGFTGRCYFTYEYGGREPEMDGTALVDSLRTLPNLRVLYLPHVRAAEIPFARFTELTNLQALFLDYSDVDDNDLAKIAELPNLVELHLDHCANVTDAGVAHVRRCPNLQRLFISGTQVSAVLRQELDAISSVLVRVTDQHGRTAQRRVPRDVRIECFVKLESDHVPFVDYDHKTIDWDHRNVRIRYFRGSGSGVVMLRGQHYRHKVEVLCIAGQQIETPPGSRIVIEQDGQLIVSMDVVPSTSEVPTLRGGT